MCEFMSCVSLSPTGIPPMCCAQVELDTQTCIRLCGAAASVLTAWAGLGAVTYFACSVVGPGAEAAFPAGVARYCPARHCAIFRSLSETSLPIGRKCSATGGPYRDN
jgi:hypothetical protein